MYESIYQAFAIVRELSEEDGGRHRDKCCRLSSQTLTPNPTPKPNPYVNPNPNPSQVRPAAAAADLARASAAGNDF